MANATVMTSASATFTPALTEPRTDAECLNDPEFQSEYNAWLDSLDTPEAFEEFDAWLPSRSGLRLPLKPK